MNKNDFYQKMKRPISKTTESVGTNDIFKSKNNE